MAGFQGDINNRENDGANDANDCHSRDDIMTSNKVMGLGEF